jgi:hypothetical protein
LDQQGGSILGNVDGVDVTVEDVGSLKEPELLNLDYGHSLQKFWRVSQLKKVLERRPPLRRIPQLVRNPVKVHTPRSEKPGNRLISKPVIDITAMRAALTPQQVSAEEVKLLQIEESIRIFVRVADPKFRQIVPMRFFNLALTSAEADAFCADYLEEKSLQAGVARILLRLVAVTARITTELEELKRGENSPSLWRLHAESLVALLELAGGAQENSSRVLALAQRHGGKEQIDALQKSMQKLTDASSLAIKTLNRSDPEQSASASASN